MTRKLKQEELMQLMNNGTYPVDVEPEIHLRSWRMLQACFKDEYPTYHLVGTDDQKDTGRVSSPVIRIDLEKRVARTRSGRDYVLVGNYGRERSGDRTWVEWSKRNQVTGYGDVSYIITELMKHEKKILRIDDAGKSSLFDPKGVDSRPDDPLA